MADVTIPSDSAASIAHELRRLAAVPAVSVGPTDLRRWADMLDPPPPSLRDEVLAVVDDAWHRDTMPEPITNRILTVVRRHVEALTLPDQPSLPSAWGNGWLACNADVLRLLGGSDE